jgi:hypothetical protein
MGAARAWHTPVEILQVLEPVTMQHHQKADELFNHLIQKDFLFAELTGLIAILIQQSCNFCLPGV